MGHRQRTAGKNTKILRLVTRKWQIYPNRHTPPLRSTLTWTALRSTKSRKSGTMSGGTATCPTFLSRSKALSAASRLRMALPMSLTMPHSWLRGPALARKMSTRLRRRTRMRRRSSQPQNEQELGSHLVSSAWPRTKRLRLCEHRTQVCTSLA